MLLFIEGANLCVPAVTVYPQNYNGSLSVSSNPHPGSGSDVLAGRPPAELD